jgi:hypothetical protein
MTREQKDLAETIAKANGGQVHFNITQAAKIAGRCKQKFPAWLHAHGVHVQKTGRGKYITVNDLVVAMTMDKAVPFGK